MNIKQLERHWEKLAETDPLWAIVARSDKKNRQWELSEFFRTGEADVAWVMERLHTMGIGLRYRRALDFGCGVGRLTHALAKYFEEVCGVDLAPSMIRLANQYNRYPSRCKFYLNDQLDLQLFTGRSFDFIYTIITLQHMKPEYAKTYLKEFLRLLTPHGILVFQMPSERLCQPNLSLKIKKFATAVVPQAVLERLKLARPSTGAIYGIERGEIQRLLVDNKAEILSTVRDDKPGPSWISYTYFVMKVEQNGDEPSSHISS